MAPPFLTCTHHPIATTSRDSGCYQLLLQRRKGKFRSCDLSASHSQERGQPSPGLWTPALGRVHARGKTQLESGSQYLGVPLARPRPALDTQAPQDEGDPKSEGHAGV